MFEILPTCSARKADWIFPESTEGKLEAHGSPPAPPSLFPLLTDQSDWIIYYGNKNVAELKTLNGKTVNEISHTLQQNSAAFSTEGVNQTEVPKFLASENAYV